MGVSGSYRIAVQVALGVPVAYTAEPPDEANGSLRSGPTRWRWRWWEVRCCGCSDIFCVHGPDDGGTTLPLAPRARAWDGRVEDSEATGGVAWSLTTGSAAVAARAAFVASRVVREATVAVRLATGAVAAEATVPTTGSAVRVTSSMRGATDAVVVSAADFAVEVVVETVPVTAATVDATGAGAGAGCEVGSETGAVGVVAAATGADGIVGGAWANAGAAIAAQTTLAVAIAENQRSALAAENIR